MNSTQQKQELFKTIWAIANELRGSVDGWDFKQYVLGMLFYRYISENITVYINRLQHEAGLTDFDYAAFSDGEALQAQEDIVREKGFFILPSQLFCNVRRRAKEDANLNETLSAVFAAIEQSAVGAASEDDMRGLFEDLDVNSTKLGNTVQKRNERLCKILDAIGDMDLTSSVSRESSSSSYSSHLIDAFGDAYEYLMTMYVGNAGKSGGEFFTPQEVSRLLALIATNGKQQVQKVYDPACGSGSLLLQVCKVLGRDNVRQGFYGQEINRTTYNLCRINMFLHDINYEKFDIALGDTLEEPKHWDDQRLRSSSPTRRIPSVGRATTIRSLSTTSVSRPQAYWHPRARRTSLLPCISSIGSPRAARRLSSSSPACCTAAERSRRYVAT